MSTLESVSLRYTGRYANDPLGEMTIEEGTFVISNGKGLFLGLCLIRYIRSATSFENALPPRP